jgi:hypothetical protein
VKLGLTLAGLAAASWITVITTDTVNLHSHVERDMLAVATIFTLTAIQWYIFGELRRSIERMGETNKQLAQAVATRPLYRDPTGPIPLLPHAAHGANGQPRHARRATP